MLRWRSRTGVWRHPGVSLVEMLIALVVLVVMLFSIMAVMIITTQGSVTEKQAMGASLAGLSELNRMEAQRVSEDIDDSARSDTGIYTLERELVPGEVPGEGEITVKVNIGGLRVLGGFSESGLKRQVSPNAWQNAGELVLPGTGE